VVIATGACDVPHVPDMGERLAPDLFQTVPTRYRNPAGLPDGGVLVVGAAASGLQLADELRRAGRSVTLAVGRHTRLPRRYRGRDILAWLDEMGVLEETAADVHDLDASRRTPSLQLVGKPDHRSLDLGALEDAGVRLVGRAMDADGDVMRFADDLADTTAAADAKLRGLLSRVDAHIDRTGQADDVPAAAPIRPVRPRPAPTGLDLRAEGIRTVLWATGFRRDYRWLKVPVLDPHGEIRHDGGVTPVPGLYVLGLRFLRRRNSNFLDGVGADARFLADHLSDHLDHHPAGRSRRESRAAA
jgi:putative flavoprotein involved in K+ transport